MKLVLKNIVPNETKGGARWWAERWNRRREENLWKLRTEIFTWSRLIDRRLIGLLSDVSGGLGRGEVVGLGLGVVLDRLGLILALLGGSGRGSSEFREVGSLRLRDFRGVDHVSVLANRCRGCEPLGRRLGVHLGLAERGRAEETGPAAGHRCDENDLKNEIESVVMLIEEILIVNDYKNVNSKLYLSIERIKSPSEFYERKFFDNFWTNG